MCKWCRNLIHIICAFFIILGLIQGDEMEMRNNGLRRNKNVKIFFEKKNKKM